MSKWVIKFSALSWWEQVTFLMRWWWSLFCTRPISRVWLLYWNNNPQVDMLIHSKNILIPSQPIFALTPSTTLRGNAASTNFIILSLTSDRPYNLLYSKWASWPSHLRIYCTQSEHPDHHISESTVLKVSILTITSQNLLYSKWASWPSHLRIYCTQSEHPDHHISEVVKKVYNIHSQG